MFKYVSTKEAIGSRTAERLEINNHPNCTQYNNMERVVENIFVPIREHFGKPIYISSFFRSEKLNYTIGGASKSQHVKGEALDLDADVYGKMTNIEIGEWLIGNLDFAQLIFEHWDEDTEDYKWIHVSCKKEDNRNQVLEAYKVNGKTKYKNYD